MIGIQVLELDRPALDSIITRTQGTLESVCGEEAIAVVIVREMAWEVLACGLCRVELHSVGVGMAKRHSSGGVQDYFKEFCF